MKNLKNALEASVLSSLVDLVEKLSKKLGGLKTLDASVTMMVTATVEVAKAMNFHEEVKLLGLLVTSRFATAGIPVPEDINRMFTDQVAPVINESGEFVRSKPAPVAVQPALPLASVPSKPAVVKTTVARKMIEPEKQFSPDNAKKTWLGQLGGIARGGKAPWPTIQATSIKLFRADMQLASEEWQILFAAMKKAMEQGRHILSSEAVLTKRFRLAPNDLLLEYIFGQDGALVAISADLHELKGEMPTWLVAKSHVTLDLIDVLDRNLASGIGDHEVARVEKLERLLKSKDAPGAILTKLEVILGGEIPQWPKNRPRIVGDLNSVVKKGKKDAFVGGVEPPPATDFALPKGDLVLQ